MTDNKLVGPVTAPVLLKSHQEIISRFRKLKLNGFAGELEEQFSAPQIFNELPFEKRIEKMLDTQELYRQNARFKTLYNRSNLTMKVYLSQLKPNPKKGLNAEDLAMLAETSYIQKNINIIISGPSGVGKSTVAAAAMMSALQHGLPSIFFRMCDLRTQLENMDDSAFALFKKKIFNTALVAIDDYGVIALDDVCAVRLYEMIDIHYQRGSIIVTSQLKKRNLKECIPQGPIKDAVYDRLFRNCDKEIILEGLSWRGSSDEIKGVPNV